MGGTIEDPSAHNGDFRFNSATGDEISKTNGIESNSYYGMKSNESMKNQEDKKLGKGTKFFNWGCNACLNAIVTRFDKNGNVQMMAMKRPQNADSDGGEYQMSAGCLFFGGKGHDLEIDGKKYEVKGPTQFQLTSGKENLDEKTGELLGRGKAYAVAAILEKLWTKNPETKKLIQSWDFYKLFAGIVDDTSNTCDSWVETGYVVHHITGSESTEEFKLFENSHVNPERKNVGEGVWRSIDKDPVGEVYSQIAVEEFDHDLAEAKFKTYWVKHSENARAFNPYVEFEFWHGDHSFVAARIADYIKANYKFTGEAEFGFGKSELNN
ncbi:MAG: hypothetical protein AB8G05_19495 [Oligoflexales bacterium]